MFASMLSSSVSTAADTTSTAPATDVTTEPTCCSDCVVLICKVPFEGRCKTRLNSCLGQKQAAELATAMLQDVLLTFQGDNGTASVEADSTSTSSDNIRYDSYWFFSPHEAEAAAIELLNTATTVGNSSDINSHNISNSINNTSASSHSNSSGGGQSTMLQPSQSVHTQQRWTLEPNKRIEGVALDLGVVLSSLLNSFSALGYRSVTFIGGDTPYLSKQDLYSGISTANSTGEAYICPATDGGFVLLTVPTAAATTTAEKCSSGVNSGYGNSGSVSSSSSTNSIINSSSSGLFNAVRWSTEHTCADQVVSLRRCGLGVRVGRTYTDIDEVRDLYFLIALHSTASIRAAERQLQQQQLIEEPELVEKEDCAAVADATVELVTQHSAKSADIHKSVTTDNTSSSNSNGAPMSLLMQLQLKNVLPESEWEHVSDCGDYSIVSNNSSDICLNSPVLKLHQLDSSNSSSSSSSSNRGNNSSSNSNRAATKFRSLLPLSPTRPQQQQQLTVATTTPVDQSHVDAYLSQCPFTQRFMRQLLS